MGFRRRFRSAFAGARRHVHLSGAERRTVGSTRNCQARPGGIEPSAGGLRVCETALNTVLTCRPSASCTHQKVLLPIGYFDRLKPLCIIAGVAKVAELADAPDLGSGG